MTVKELEEQLKTYPGDYTVILEIRRIETPRGYIAVNTEANTVEEYYASTIIISGEKES